MSFDVEICDSIKGSLKFTFVPGDLSVGLGYFPGIWKIF